MVRYILKRCFMIIPTVLGVVFVVFVMLYILPGSSLDRMPVYGGGDALDSLIGVLRIGNNLFAQYCRYCWNIFTRFDFGLPQSFDVPNRIRMTLILMSLGGGLAIAAGLPAGMYAAIHRNQWQDHTIMFLVLLFSSIPSYCIAYLLCLFFVLHLKILPLFGSASPIYFVLPTLTMSAGGLAMMVRITRSSLLEVLDQNYITALRSKGLAERTVICFHALRNATVPILSSLGNLAAQLLCGTFVAEYFFSVSGIGSLLLEAVVSRNHLAVLCSAVVITAILSSITIAADLLFTLVNPKIKQQFVRRFADKPGSVEESV